jgi:hypothetical protein
VGALQEGVVDLLGLGESLVRDIIVGLCRESRPCDPYKFVEQCLELPGRQLFQCPEARDLLAISPCEHSAQPVDRHGAGYTISKPEIAEQESQLRSIRAPTGSLPDNDPADAGKSGNAMAGVLWQAEHECQRCKHPRFFR